MTTKLHAVQVKIKEDKGTISGAKLSRIPGMAGMDHRLLQGCERWCVCDLTGAKGLGIFQVTNYVREKA